MAVKQFLNAFINNSSTIREKTAAAITNAAHKAVTYNSDGNLILPASNGVPALGFVLSDTPGNESGTDIITPAGTEIDVIIKDIGLAEAGAAIAKGAAVTVTSAGKVQTASTGNFIIGFALTAASAAGELVQVQITKSGYASA